jgi:branched-chain amino acid aminotransferase
MSQLITPPTSRSDSPTLDTTAALTKAGVHHAHEEHLPPTPSDPYQELSASLLSITPTTTPLPVPAQHSAAVAAQNAHTDHILTCVWKAETGWAAPEIKPFEELKISPLASVLHYATECFEGLKAYRGVDGEVRLFRLDRNAERFVRSAERIALPSFPPGEFVELVKKFVGLEARRWLPKVEDGKGGYEERMLYLRPTMIATHPALGVQRPREAMMFVVGVMFPNLDEPEVKPAGLPAVQGVMQQITGNHRVLARGMKLLASNHDMIRAWPGGFGHAKVGANYGPSLVAQGEAMGRGYQQILWLFGEEGFVTEAGGSNFFVLWKNESGEMELVTAPLGDGVILPGVTRASVLDLARQRLPDVKVVERRFTMDEIVKASKEGRLQEAFACGTAFFVSPISDIHFRGQDVVFPVGKDGAVGNQGKETTMAIKGWLRDIMYGREKNDWAVIVDESQH